MIFQSSITARPDVALPGQKAEAFGPYRGVGRIARGLVKAGYAVFKSPVTGGAGSTMLDPGEVYQIPTPGAAASVNAIKTSFASSASVQTFSGAALNGAVGGATMQPARSVTLVLSSHADWDATNATLTGVNQHGVTVSETLAIPDGGNTTLTSVNSYKSVTSLSIPAQSGAGGTATVGVSALTTLTAALLEGFALREPVKTTISSSALYYAAGTSGLVTADFHDNETVTVLKTGGIWAACEEDSVLDGDPVYVRIAAGAGGSNLGAVRNDADTATCVLLPGARFTRDGRSASGASKIWVPYV